MLNAIIHDELFCLECMYGSDVTGTMGYANFIGSEQEGSYTRIEVSLRTSTGSISCTA